MSQRQLQQQQQLTFMEHVEEHDALKFLGIMSKHYSQMSNNYRNFWTTIHDECHAANVYPEKSIIDFYKEIWPNFLQTAKMNLQNASLTRIDQSVIDISRTRNPHWWTQPIAVGTDANVSAILDYRPPKLEIMEPESAESSQKTRTSTRVATQSSTPTAVANGPRKRGRPPLSAMATPILPSSTVTTPSTTPASENGPRKRGRPPLSAMTTPSIPTRSSVKSIKNETSDV